MREYLPMVQNFPTGIVETEAKKYVVAKSDMRRLKAILDRRQIHYILDRVSYHSTGSSLALAKAIHEKDVWKVEKDGSIHLDNQFGHSGKHSYAHMVVYANLLSIYLQDSDHDILTNQERLFLRRFK